MRSIIWTNMIIVAVITVTSEDFYFVLFSPPLHICILSCRCCASCVTDPAFALVPPPSAPSGCLWCWMAADAARCVPGSEASPAPRGFPAIPREDCSATTAPASLETLGSVSVSGSSCNKQTTRPMSVWVR